MKDVFRNFRLEVEGLRNAADKCYHAGKLFIKEEALMARFIAYPPRVRRARNKKVYQDQCVRVMQCPDGSYVMSVSFAWEGKGTWRLLLSIIRNVYQAIKVL